MPDFIEFKLVYFRTDNGWLHKKSWQYVDCLRQFFETLMILA